MEQMILEFQRGILEEIQIGDDLSRHQGEDDEQKTRIGLRDDPERSGRFVYRPVTAPERRITAETSPATARVIIESLRSPSLPEQAP